MVATVSLPRPTLSVEQSVLRSEFVPFIESVVWGTEGARYRLKDYGDTLDHLPQPFYLALKKENRLHALRMILEKKAKTPSGPLHVFYHSLFCVDPAEKGHGYGKRLAREMLERLQPLTAPRGLIYSHVEVDNVRSANVHKGLGYQTLGQFSVMSFSRFFPKKSPRVIALPSTLQPLVLKALHDQYADHALTDFELSLSPKDYYVLIENGDILAGVQSLPQRWVIDHLQGIEGRVALSVLPKVPLIRDLFNPKDFQFLKFGNLFFKSGHAGAAFELMQSVLALHQRKTAMLFLDHSSPVYQSLAKAGRFGLLNALTETPVNIFGMPYGMSDVEISDFRRRPKVISPVDI